MKLSTRLSIIVISSILGLLLIGGLGLHSLRSSLMAERHNQIATLLNLSEGLVSSYYKQEQEGKLTREEAQKRAAEALMGLQHGTDYMIARDADDILIAHAMRNRVGKVDKGTRLPNGKLATDGYRDILATGVKIGFVDTYANKPGHKAEDQELKLNGITRFEPWGWVLATGFFVDDIEATYMFYVKIMISAGLLILALTTTLCVVFSRQIYARLGGEPDYAAKMVEAVSQGDLTQQLANARAGSLLAGLGRMQQSMRELIARVQKDSRILRETSSELNVTMEQIGQSAQHSADAASSTAASVEQMTVSVGLIADSARDTESHSSHAAELAKGGATQVKEAVVQIQTVSKGIEGASNQIVSLAERTRLIGNIANVIQDIAEQTNLLALNAAIEAARAGEQGRGFAVVADEVRKLAERTTKATAEIKATIQSVQNETGEVVTSIQSLVPQMASGVGKAESAAQALDEISTSTEATLHKIHDVAHATAEQNTASTSIAANIERIAAMVEESELSMRTAGASVVELDRMAADLNQALAHFKL
ncbi:methyl-accepting chemotaxis protein [Uliginosibacterium gangwonense]|uniref:methyl-accepting chemotaxis protein n=1 Tax=Uliginosibacterium gangwonense TaxID=392736 RepID=UPI00035C5FBB|nr:methyl-accepting chemotaxis protein [Uliginosibacterium gangwonense]